jgi:hypothetical protein
MHLAKGLEFHGVVGMACDDDIVPPQERIETVGDDADLQEDRAALALCRPHPRPRSFAGDERRRTVGISGPSANLNAPVKRVAEGYPRLRWASTYALRTEFIRD